MEKLLNIGIEVLYTRLQTHWRNHKRGLKLAAEETEGSKAYIMQFGQAQKAMGFKEAYDEMLFPFTGLVVNIDDKTGEIIRPENKGRG